MLASPGSPTTIPEIKPIITEDTSTKIEEIRPNSVNEDSKEIPISLVPIGAIGSDEDDISKVAAVVPAKANTSVGLQNDDNEAIVVSDPVVSIAPDGNQLTKESVAPMSIPEQPRVEPIVQAKPKRDITPMVPVDAVQLLYPHLAIQPSTGGSMWLNGSAWQLVDRITSLFDRPPNYVDRSPGGMVFWKDVMHNGIMYRSVQVTDRKEIAELPYPHYPVLSVVIKLGLKASTGDKLRKLGSLVSWFPSGSGPKSEVTIVANRLSVILMVIDIVLRLDIDQLTPGQAKDLLLIRLDQIVNQNVAAEPDLIQSWSSLIKEKLH